VANKWPNGVEIHHLIEKRFASTLKITEDEIPGLVLTEAEHDRFTQAWLDEIGRRNMKVTPNTTTATIDDIWEAAKNVYEEYPVLQEYCRRFLGK
jgi:hypothetical protein